MNETSREVVEGQQMFASVQPNVAFTGLLNRVLVNN